MASEGRMVAPARQARSRDTLERMVAATEELLRDRPFEAVTITEIVTRARASVGSFYARFPNKEALLDLLDERYTERVLQAGRELLAPGRWNGVPLWRVVHALVETVVALHRAAPGVTRAVLLHARTHPGGVVAERSARMDALIPELFRLMLSRRDEIGHPHPERAVPIGLLQLVHVVREVVLFPSADDSPAIPDAELVDELAESYLAYLRVERPELVGKS